MYVESSSVFVVAYSVRTHWCTLHNVCRKKGAEEEKEENGISRRRGTTTKNLFKKPPRVERTRREWEGGDFGELGKVLLLGAKTAEPRCRRLVFPLWSILRTLMGGPPPANQPAHNFFLRGGDGAKTGVSAFLLNFSYLSPSFWFAIFGLPTLLLFRGRFTNSPGLDTAKPP